MVQRPVSVLVLVIIGAVFAVPESLSMLFELRSLWTGRWGDPLLMTMLKDPVYRCYCYADAGLGIAMLGLLWYSLFWAGNMKAVGHKGLLLYAWVALILQVGQLAFYFLYVFPYTLKPALAAMGLSLPTVQQLAAAPGFWILIGERFLAFVAFPALILIFLNTRKVRAAYEGNRTGGAFPVEPERAERQANQR